MKMISVTIGQTILLLVLGLVVGLGANSVRAKGHIDLWRNYVPQTQTNATPGNPNPAGTTEAPLPFQVLTFEAASAIWKDPETQAGLYVFLDARGDHPFEQGHIPGAWQCDPYGPAATMDAIAGRVAGAGKVITYCNGGDCEDSILLCQELVMRGIPKETLFVFKGGWEEWKSNQMPVVTGREE